MWHTNHIYEDFEHVFISLVLQRRGMIQTLCYLSLISQFSLLLANTFLGNQMLANVIVSEIKLPLLPHSLHTPDSILFKQVMISIQETKNRPNQNKYKTSLYFFAYNLDGNKCNTMYNTICKIFLVLDSI